MVSSPTEPIPEPATGTKRTAESENHESQLRDCKKPRLSAPTNLGDDSLHADSNNCEDEKLETAPADPKEESSDAPPLPDEQPPLPDEQPPLPNEGPPLPNEAPPLPAEQPPLPDEAPPTEDDGWEPVWDATAQAYYFYNRLTHATQWENPRVPDASSSAGVGTHDRIPPAPGTSSSAVVGSSSPPPRRPHGGYNPAIHGDYDPTADYAIEAQAEEEERQRQEAIANGTYSDPNAYSALGRFNRYTGRWQDPGLTPERFNDENKSKRQMSAFFDVDAAANSHDGRSLKAERQSKKLTKAEVKAFREKRKEKKEEKRRAWLRD